MATDDCSNRATLRRIAHRAMLERGLQPDFSPALTAELSKLGSRFEPAVGARDLRYLSWPSIDIDDSLDLDHSPWCRRCPEARRGCWSRLRTWTPDSLSMHWQTEMAAQTLTMQQ